MQRTSTARGEIKTHAKTIVALGYGLTTMPRRQSATTIARVKVLLDGMGFAFKVRPHSKEI